MSLRYWNSVAERARFQRYIFISELLLLQEIQDDSSSDSSMDLMSLEGDLLLDDDITFMTASTDDETEEEDDGGNVDMVSRAIRVTLNFAKYIYSPIVDPTINFNEPPLHIRDLDESKCLLDFRFRKAELQEIADRLWPKLGLILVGDRDNIKCMNKYSCPYETGLLLIMFRLSRPRRIRPEMENYFCIRKSKISAVISTFIDALYDLALPYVSEPSIFQHRFELYSRLIHRKCRLGGLGVWGFIDGTLRKTCRPSRFQKLVYSGHKRSHGIKFQSVTTPDGLIALLFGPINGNRHDSYMLAESGLLPKLRALFPPGSVRYSLYGDPAYPQSELLFGGFRGAQPGSDEAEWNTRMSSVREAVEWLFKEIITKWSFLDFRASMKIFQFPVAKYFLVATFLTNLHSCCHGSETAAYFDCTEPEDGRLTMEQYIALVP
jgi:DDE superfamily endonuclease